MNESAPQPRVETLLAQATWVTNLVRSMVRDADLADDVVQDTLVRAIERAPRATDLRSLRSWMAKVARRLAMRRVRSELARRRRELAVAVGEAVDPTAIEERVVLQRMLAAAVLELDATTRTAVILCYQDGLSANAIASRLGITHAAARQRLSRGVARLRQRLEQQHGKGRHGWIAVFAPLLRGPVASMLPGAAKVSRRIWSWLAAAPLAAVASWLVWSSGMGSNGGPIDGPIEGNAAVVAGAVPDAGASTSGPGSATRAATATATATAGDAVPAGIDRELDLHGHVRDAGGQPIAGAVIEALPVDESTYRADVSPPSPPLARTQSDARGAFALRLEVDAIVDLSIHAAGYGDELRPYLRAGERVEVQLARAGSLLGRVVRAADGQPLAGVPVRVVRTWFGDGIARELARALSGPDGEFAVAALPPCRVAIEVAAPGAACQPTVVAIEAGGSVQAVLAIGEGRAVRGRVRDADSGQPIAEARVVGSYAHLSAAVGAHRVPSALAVGRSWAPAFERRSDASGGFEVRLPTDFAPVQVRVAAAGYAACTLPVAADAAADLDVSLRRGWSACGRVVGPDGVPIIGARVAAAAVVVIGGIESSDWCAVVTDVDGRFAIADLSTDLSYHLVVRQPGLAPCIMPLAPPNGAAAAQLGDLVLARPAAVRGVVTGDDGAPEPGIYLTCENEAGDVLVRARSDDLGRFAAGGLPPGRVLLCTGRVREPIELEPGAVRDGVQIAVASEGVFGVVVDVVGAPIHNALVLLVDAAGGTGPRNFVSGSDGRFAFEGVSPGRYSLRVAPNSIHLDGGNRMVHQVQLAGIEPSPVEVRVVLPPARATRGVVVDADGRPLGHTLVFARYPGGELATYEMTAADGTFVLRLPPDSVVDLAVGKEAPHRIVVRGIRDGATDLRIVRER
ncbi:MAG: sigma-70 family RNA polymerase sigma factor [Planctomycetota bacterium]